MTPSPPVRNGLFLNSAKHLIGLCKSLPAAPIEGVPKWIRFMPYRRMYRARYRWRYRARPRAKTLPEAAGQGPRDMLRRVRRGSISSAQDPFIFSRSG